MRNTVLLAIVVLICSCRANEDSTADNILQPLQKINPDYLVDRLSMHMASTADTSLTALETNRIIEYCIDNGLDVQWHLGLAMQVISEGEGAKLQWGDPVKIHYEGRFLNGEVFDSSIARGKPIKTYVGKFIQSWNEALTQVGVDGELFIISPSSKAYGANGFQNIVGPNEILAFQIKVLPMLTESQR